ncbi:partitioning defective 3 homolog isoform X2 [Tachypleus tridentatus]|uniref:partitioning defective 3 homolog isoform X2 n=1 Tax=Tachypleus tridentatus TaxID=6853 RepID=UPI003FD2610E
MADVLTKVMRRTQKYDILKAQRRFSLESTHAWITVHNLKLASDDGILDDAANDKKQIITMYKEQDSPFTSHNGGDDMSTSFVRTENLHIFRRGGDIHPKEKQLYSKNDRENTADHISNGVTGIHMHRGSEPALNCLSPISGNPDLKKRWSSTVVMDCNTCRTSRTPSADDLIHSVNDLTSGPADGSHKEEKRGFVRASQVSGRLSMLGSGSDILQWEEAADRQLLRMQNIQKEPLDGPEAPPDLSEDRDSDSSGDSNESDQELVIQGIEPGVRIVQEPEIRMQQIESSLSAYSTQFYKKPPFPVYSKYMFHKGRLEDESEKADLVKEQEEDVLSPNFATVISSAKVSSFVPLSQKNTPLTSNTRKIGRKFSIQLTKGYDGLGFSITTRDNPAGGNCPVYIKNILLKGAAIQDGRLKPGDRLLEVNGVEMTGLSQKEAVGILRAVPSGGTVNLTLSRQELDLTPNFNLPQEWSLDEAEDEYGIYPWKSRDILTFEIPLNSKESGGLGISVTGKTTTTKNSHMDLGIFVKSVIRDGAASKDGRLLTNDQLVKINGISLLNMTNTEALNVLNCAVAEGEDLSAVPKAIKLTIARQKHPDNETVDQFSSFDQNKNNNISLNSSIGDSYNRDVLEIQANPQKNEIFTQVSSGCENSESKLMFVPRLSTDGNNNTERLSMSLKKTKQQGRNTIIGQLISQGIKTSAFCNESYLGTNHENCDDNQLQALYGENIFKNDVSISPTVNLSVLDFVMVKGLYESPAQPKSAVETTIAENLLSSLTNDISYTEEGKEENESEGILEDKELRTNSQVLLDDESQFTLSRDGFGRKSISEKRHAQLDAHNSDTFQRNKKAREERERLKKLKSDEKDIPQYQQQQEQYQQPNLKEQSILLQDICVNKLEENVPCCGGYNNSTEPQMTHGFSIRLRKSSSLESFQTFFHDLQKDDKKQTLISRLLTRKVARARGCNENLKTATDHSCEGPVTETKENLTEENDTCSSMGSKVCAGPALIGKFHHIPATSDHVGVEHNLNKATKKRSFLKELGLVFKFRKNKKLAQEQISKSFKERNVDKEEVSQACGVFWEKQGRIHKQRDRQELRVTCSKGPLNLANNISLQNRQNKVHQLRTCYQQEQKSSCPRHEEEVTDLKLRQKTKTAHNRTSDLGIYRGDGKARKHRRFG